VALTGHGKEMQRKNVKGSFDIGEEDDLGDVPWGRTRFGGDSKNEGGGMGEMPGGGEGRLP